MKRTAARLDDVAQALKEVQHQTDLIKHVLIVKEPGSQLAADAFEGLRRQIVAGAAERRSHLVQVVAMAVAVGRATAVADLEPMVGEWMAQSGITAVASSTPDQFHLLFDDLDGGTLDGAEAIDVVEPAYVDTVTGAVIRTGRARRAARRPAAAAAEAPAGVQVGADTTSNNQASQGDDRS
jgi:hypothetical protein